MEKQIFVEKQPLSDNSFAYNVVIDGQLNGIGTSRLRLLCASQLDAETIEEFLACQVAAHRLIGIE